MKHHRTVPFVSLVLFWLMPLIAVAQSEGPADSDASIPNRVPMHEEDEDHHRIREAWFESLHRCEPGLNWRVIDRENRRAIGAVRAMALGKRAPRSMQGVPDTVPGVISGTWSERGSRNLAGRILHADVDMDRGIIYAASDGGTIWRGTLEGEEWRSLNDTLRMPVITMIKALPRAAGKRLVAMTESPATLYLSDDDGLSWHQNIRGLGLFTTTGASRKGVVLGDASRTVYLLGMEFDSVISGSASTLYRSTDGCDSFAHVLHINLPMTMIDIWAPDDRSGELMMLHRDTLSRILPDGSRMVMGQVPREPYTNRVYLTGTRAGGKLRLYAAMERMDSVRWFVSADTGRTWNMAGVLPRPFSHNGIAASGVDAASAFVGSVNCYRSGDSARTFRAVSDWTEYYSQPERRLHADIFGIHPFRDRDGSEFILICTDGGIYISRDTLRTVRNISMQGLNVSQYYSVLTNWRDPYICHAGSQDQGYQRSRGGGAGPLEFTQVLSGDYGGLASSDSGRTVWANYPGITLLVTENERGEPKPIRTANFKGMPQHWMTPLVADVHEPLVAYMPAADETGDGSYIWRLDARSSTIQSERMPFDFSQGNGRVSSIGISPGEPWRWYVMTDGGRFFRSEDIGATWEMSFDTSIGGGFFSGTAILPSAIDPMTVYTAGSGYSTTSVRVSTDGGLTFTPITDGLPRTLVYDLAADPEERHLFAATEVGPFVYSMKLRRWYYLGGASAPEQAYTSVEYIPATRTARFATYGRGIWDFVADKGASVERAAAPASLPVLALSAAPNPAAAQTTFLFRMPAAGHATVRVYDLAGREIAALVDDDLEAGEHAVSWDLRPHGGGVLSSGSYTCVISAGGSIGFTRLEIVR